MPQSVSPRTTKCWSGASGRNSQRVVIGVLASGDNGRAAAELDANIDAKARKAVAVLNFFMVHPLERGIKWALQPQHVSADVVLRDNTCEFESNSAHKSLK